MRTAIGKEQSSVGWMIAVGGVSVVIFVNNLIGVGIEYEEDCLVNWEPATLMRRGYAYGWPFVFCVVEDEKWERGVVVPFSRPKDVVGVSIIHLIGNCVVFMCALMLTRVSGARRSFRRISIANILMFFVLFGGGLVTMIRSWWPLDVVCIAVGSALTVSAISCICRRDALGKCTL